MIHMESPVTLKIEEFHRRHGGECYSDGSMWWYPDGASRDVDKNGVMKDPWPGNSPESIVKNADNVVTFHTVKLKYYVTKFDEMNERLMFTVPANQKAALEELKKLQLAVQKSKRELAAAEAKRDATEIGRRRKSLAEARQEERSRFHEFQQQRRSIRI